MTTQGVVWTAIRPMSKLTLERALALRPLES